MTARFPDGFRWGAATAAYQIEGAVTADGRTPSIWDTFSHTPGTVLDGSNGDVACEHYRFYRDDIALMAELGLTDYRFSISWTRVLPDSTGTVNASGLDFYSRLVDALIEHGIRPMATLYHWDLPQHLQDAGGWTNRDTAAHFADLASTVAAGIGDRVDCFTTVNEPWCSAFLGYASGEHAPGLRDNASALSAAHHLLLAHGLGTAALRSRLRPDQQVSITLNPAVVVAASEDEPDQRAAQVADLLANRLFLEPLLRGRLPTGLVEATASVTDWSFVHDGDLEQINAPIDFLGVNYYTPALITGRSGPDTVSWPGCDDVWSLPMPGPQTAMGWRIDPGSFTRLLIDLDRDYDHVPIIITENGAAFPDVVAADGAVADGERAQYLRTHIDAVGDALTAGVDVRGYLVWSLLDNFEWAWGYAQRFGIVHVDFATQQRRLKDSARLYQQVIADYVAAREHAS